jgi:hypothetical protein
MNGGCDESPFAGMTSRIFAKTDSCRDPPFAPANGFANPKRNPVHRSDTAVDARDPMGNGGACERRFRDAPELSGHRSKGNSYR